MQGCLRRWRSSGNRPAGSAGEPCKAATGPLSPAEALACRSPGHGHCACAGCSGAVPLQWGRWVRGIGFSNDMFLAPPGRTRTLGGVAGGALAWPGERWAAATPPPELKSAWTSGKPLRLAAPHRALPGARRNLYPQPGVSGRLQAACSKPPLASAWGGARACSPRCVRIRPITGASSQRDRERVLDLTSPDSHARDESLGQFQSRKNLQ